MVEEVEEEVLLSSFFFGWLNVTVVFSASLVFPSLIALELSDSLAVTVVVVFFFFVEAFFVVVFVSVAGAASSVWTASAAMVSSTIGSS
ncbi:MAG: hypothetical protein J6X35_09800 [Bacteroidales bacterium]|nr:hypothetical protein [Bacteroidales bacterium]